MQTLFRAADGVRDSLLSISFAEILREHVGSSRKEVRSQFTHGRGRYDSFELKRPQKVDGGGTGWSMILDGPIKFCRNSLRPVNVKLA